MSLVSQVSAALTRIGQEFVTLRSVFGDPLDEGRALRTFRGAYLGGVATTPTDILIVGASTEEGYGTTQMNNAWPMVFRDDLRAYAQPKGMAGGGSISGSVTPALYQAGVGNYFGFGGIGRYTGGADGTYPDTPMFGVSGTFSVTTTFGLGLRGIAALTNGATFSLEWFGTGMDLVYSTDPTFGAFTWAVDGGSTTAVNTNPASSNGNRVQIRGLARGRHTVQVVVTSLGSGGAVAYEGAAFYDGDEGGGIRVWQAARAGYSAFSFVATTGQTGWINSIQTWNLPDLVIINLGFNDWTQGRTSAQWKTDTLAIIAAIKARCNTLSAGFVPSFVLMTMFAATPAGSAHVEPWANFIIKAREIAQADEEVCHFDFQKWFGRPTETAISTRGGILVADGVHASDSGAAIMGGALAEFVLGSAERMRDLVRYGTQAASPTYNAAITTPAAGFAADTYVTGSAVAIPVGRIKPGAIYRCKLKVSKTGAGVATPIVQVRLGTAATTADTSRATLTFAAQTAVADDGFIEVFVTVRATGSSTGVIHAVGVLDHSLAATGLSTANTSIKEATSSTFDTTTPTFIGISVNGGTSAAWTISMVQAELQGCA
jgi:lysophospholipase L1-like esterase